MRKIIFIALVFCLSSCSTYVPLYNWGGGEVNKVTAYELSLYDYYSKQTPKSLCNLISVYEKMTSKPGGQRNVPPPGICAEYAYLLVKPETLTTFQKNATGSQKKLFKGKDLNTYFHEHAQEMFEKEIEYYPESAVFIKPLMKKLVNN